MPHQAFANTTGRNASDIALVIDAMDLLHTDRFDGFCLESSDSDFTRFAARIRKQGPAVHGVGAAITPEAFRQACKQFFPTAKLLSQPPNAKTKKAAKLPLLEQERAVRGEAGQEEVDLRPAAAIAGQFACGG